MAVIKWATLVRRNVVGNGINAVAGQDRTGTRLVAGLLPPALLPGGHRSMPSSEPDLADPYPASGAMPACGLRAGRSGRFAGSLDSQSLAAVASQAAQQSRFAGSPVVTASFAGRSDGCWCERTDAKRATTTTKLADRLRPRSAHRKPTLSKRGYR